MMSRCMPLVIMKAQHAYTVITGMWANQDSSYRNIWQISYKNAIINKVFLFTCCKQEQIWTDLSECSYIGW